MGVENGQQWYLGIYMYALSPINGTYANSADPDQTPQNAAIIRTWCFSIKTCSMTALLNLCYMSHSIADAQADFSLRWAHMTDNNSFVP